MSDKPPGDIDDAELAAEADAARIGYSSELYALLTESGLQGNLKILDVACGTGAAAEPLAAAGAHITGIDPSQEMLKVARERIPKGTFIEGKAEALPFEDGAFDGAICAQGFHLVDREKSMEELVRVVKRGGVLAIWWKHLMADDPIKAVRSEVARSLSYDVPDAGLQGGFLEFYRAPLLDHALRVLPWRMSVPLERFTASERSRLRLQGSAGPKRSAYLASLERKLREKFGAEDPFVPLSYMQFLYIGKKS
ncbi:MAG: methyltransferase domain-containing protein [Candidatus Eremiobacteraeota bacterium]|nr:methyltransferase domain-containing protein [Candidatus Eremiobacteraeota bacterium]